jgi:outer membrane protein TolC
MRGLPARWGVARGRAAIALLGVAATACSTAHYDRYETLREDWRRSEASAPAADRGDALFAGAPELLRGELVRQVLARSPSIRAARHAWRAALAIYPQVTSLEDPMLGAGVAPRSFDSDMVDDGYRFDLAQALPFPGKLRLKGEAALGEADAAAHDYTAVRLRLAAMASLLFDDYALAARSLDINGQHVALLEEFQRIAAARYAAGEASQQDPIQAEVERMHALHREIVLATSLRVVAEQINALLHRAPTAPLPPPSREAAIPPDPGEPPGALIASALAQSPEILAAGARVAAEQARVDLARREYFPDFTVTGAYDRIWQEEDLQPFVGLQMNVPLQIGRRRAAVEEAEARLAQAQSERLAAEDGVRAAVQPGADRLEEARHLAHLVHDRLLPAARDQVEAARSGFETGRDSFLVLIDAQRNLLDAELDHADALAEIGRRRAELDRAVGRVPGLDW